MSRTWSGLGSLVAIAAISFTVLVGAAAPAQAAEADGCSGTVTTFDAAGAPLDIASAPGQGATEEQPLVIDTSGTAIWDGTTDRLIAKGTYEVKVAGIPVQSGDFTNDKGTQKSSGTYDLNTLPDAASFALAALGNAKIPVSATVVGEGGTCTASGWVTGEGSPFASPLFYTGLFFLLLFVLWFLFILFRA